MWANVLWNVSYLQGPPMKIIDKYVKYGILHRNPLKPMMGSISAPPHEL